MIKLPLHLPSGLLALFTACQPDVRITLEGTVLEQEQHGTQSRGCQGEVPTMSFLIATFLGEKTITLYPQEDDPYALPTMEFLAEEVIEPGARVELYEIPWEDAREDEVLRVSSRAISAFSRYYPLEEERP